MAEENKTSREAVAPKMIEYVTHIAFMFEGFGMVVSSLLIVVTLLLHKSMRKNQSQMYTVIGLAIADGIYGTGTFTGGVRRLYMTVAGTIQTKMSSWECLLEFPTMCYIAGSQMTALAMVLISVDRLMAVQYPVWYLKLDPRRRARNMVSAVVAFGVATGALAAASSHGDWGDAGTHERRYGAVCLSTWATPPWYATIYTSFVAICSYISVAVYALVLVSYRRYTKRTHGLLAGGDLMKFQLQRERRLTITMGFVALCTLLFYSIPYTIIILTTVLQLKNSFVGLLNPLLWSLVCVNSLANIFIYLKRHAEIRCAMYDVLRCRFSASIVHPGNTITVHPNSKHHEK